jgi:hypothetical protein
MGLLDQLSSGLLGGTDPTAQLGLSILAGNTYSPVRQPFGSIVGRGVLGAQQQQTELQKQQLAKLQLALMQQKMQYFSQFLPPVGGAPQADASGMPPQQGAPQAPMQGGGGGAGGAPGGQGASLPQGFAPVTQQDIAGTQVPGVPSAQQQYSLAAINEQDPSAALEKYRAAQSQVVKQQHAAPIAKLDTLIKSDTPARYAKSDGDVQRVWGAVAPQLGFDPVKDYNDQNLRTVLSTVRNQLAASVGENVEAPIVPVQHVPGRLGSSFDVNSVTGERKQVQGEEPLKDVSDGKGGFTYLPASQAVGKQSVAAANATFTPQESDLMGALAERGVSLPTGFRSAAQQKALYSGLIERNPGKSSDEIADAVKGGKISLAAATKEAVTGAAITGKIEYAQNELRQSIPLAREASGAVNRGKFVPLNKLMQMANTSISDPDLLNLKIKTQSVLNAYDMLAARGGTDVGKRAAQHALLESAQSPQAYETALQALEQEANVAKKAGDITMGRTPATGGAVSWNDLK